MGVDFIEFPKLGIRLNVSPEAFELGPFLGIGPISVHWYGIIIATAILVSLILATKQAGKFKIREEDLIDMFLLALPVSVIFSRLFFVVFKWDMFKNDLKRILYIWEGGVAIYGAVIGAILSVFIFSRVRKINMWTMTDFACVYLPLSQAIGRWGNFFNQELYGTNTDLPWGMTGSIIQAFPDAGINPDIPVHPTFLYESLWNIFIFILLLSIRKRNKVPGRVFAWYLLLYSLGRFMTEFMRVDDFQSVNNVRYNQAFAAVIFLGAFIFLIIAATRQRARKRNPVYDTPSAYADILNTMKDEENLQQEVDSNDTEPVLSDNENRETASDPIPEADVEKPVEAGKANIAETGDNNEIVSPEPSDD